MKSNFILMSAVFTASFYFAQVSPSKMSEGMNGLHADFIRFDKDSPGFEGAPVLFDANSKSLSKAESKKLNSDVDQLGIETFKFQQMINGIPVEYAVMNVQVKDGKILGESGKWILTPKINQVLTKKVNLSEAIALENALSYVGAKQYKWEDSAEEEFLKSESKNVDASFRPKGELVYYSDPSDEALSKISLAYKFDIYAAEPLSRQFVFVDAKSGIVLGTEAIIKETNAPGTAVTAYSGSKSIIADQVSSTSYRLRETGRNGGTSVETYNLKKKTNYSSAVDFTDTDNTWNNVNTSLDQYATDAHWGAEMTVDYYYTKFGRKSIDNNNFTIKSYVHYSSNYFNAFWDGSRMTYGDGSSANGNKPLTALDVCGHEITHGLTTKTANLAYQKESGALNEGFSDIFGNTIEYWARPEKYSWKLGEDFNYVIRDMANPNSYSQPDTYAGTYWKTVSCTPTSSNDYCGVHTNSGVLNFWYYLLVNGGSGTNDKSFAYNVTGIGIDKAAAIAYRTLTTYLSSSSTFANARTYSIQAATDLYGASGSEVTQVTNAWNAVGVGGGTSASGKIASVESSYKIINTSNGEFSLKFNSNDENIRSIEVLSTTGVRVSSKNTMAIKGDNNIEMKIPSTMLSGVYFVIVNGQKVGSVIKR